MEIEKLFKSVGGVPLIRGVHEVAWYFGWIPNKGEVNAHLRRNKLKMFSDAGTDLKGSGAGKTVLLYEAVRKVWKRDLDPGPQKIGDCVSWGYGGAIDLLACVEVLAGEMEQYSWDLRASTEVIYALSRVEYGNLDGSYEDGSYGAWAADAVTLGGTLSRARIGPYDPNRAKEWGAKGLPDKLEPEAKEHIVISKSLVQSFEEARDAIANGYPVVVCSSQGFQLVRDNDGFALTGNDPWHHCMKFIATRDDKRPGLLCMNSWGNNSPTGPKGEYNIPDGSFWVDASICNDMFSWNDSYAISGFKGYPIRSELIALLS